MMGVERKKINNRPLSPFLTVYRPQITSIFSILERVSGIVLVLVIFLGALLLKIEPIFLTYYWFYSISYGIVKGSLGGIVIGTLVLFVLLNMVYHIVFGVRYLYWDRGYSRLTMGEIEKSTPILVGIIIVLTLLVWFW